MGVYVDEPVLPLGRMKMCHMIADTLDELYAMARNIGVDTIHFQGGLGVSFPHFDISKGKRLQALKFGAKAVTSAELVAVMRRFREKNPHWRSQCLR